MGYCRQVHHFLNGSGAEHGKTGLAASHHVGVVTEDTQRVRRDGARRDVDDARQLFASYLVHVWYHEQQALRCCIGRGQRTRLERAMNGAGCASLRLHFLYRNGLSE